jgi:hypothetical protein
MVACHVPSDDPDYLVIALAAGYEAALAADHFRHRPSPKDLAGFYGQRIAKMLA